MDPTPNGLRLEALPILMIVIPTTSGTMITMTENDTSTSKILPLVLAMWNPHEYSLKRDATATTTSNFEYLTDIAHMDGILLTTCHQAMDGKNMMFRIF